MKTDFVKTAIIGGGASGLFCALLLKNSVVVLEKGPRAGRKLSATGNGQGNLSNTVMNADCYFPEKNRGFVRCALERFGSVQPLWNNSNFFTIRKTFGLFLYLEDFNK